ncbi:RNA polymerase sigma-70 factor [Kibdelosporangium aridum]|uniref:RNA polymerase sigma-70 factor n=2 Tax=Kibdelosporangium aridum TaxID=2030 RepID=A0A428YK40_KIBAR|nr:RNA polymerase sigma-70 factor [Kibdelosporangium aridum]
MGMTDEFEDVWRRDRGRVLDVAYRMLGSITDAEEAVQEAFLRLARQGLGGVTDARGWLITTTARICLDRLRAEKARSEYVGPWLPEPVVDLPGGGPDPADRITMDDTVRMALLIMLESLSPAERTAFVLHDVFGLSFAEVGEVVGRTPAACRQLASRARRHLHGRPVSRPRFEVDSAVRRRVAERFAAACRNGNLDELVAVLDPDVTGEFDSAGLIPGAPLAAVTGADEVARTLATAFIGVPAVFEVVDVNAAPGVLVRLGSRVVTVISLEISGDHVAVLHAIGNPAKLSRLNRPAEP